MEALWMYGNKGDEGRCMTRRDETIIFQSVAQRKLSGHAQ